MRKRLIKTATSGTKLYNSSPKAIEELLVGEMKEALGEWKDAVRIKPFLKIEDDDSDLSGNVKNGFGAIELTVYKSKLFIPFIIADKTLLPFDTIRMGDQEISYDMSKLRRIVNGIEHKSKSQQGQSEGGEFQTMEVAKFEDAQYNNGFLGTVMNIRDNHRTKNLSGDTPWDGPGFGINDTDRMLRTAQVDILDGFHNVMEKIAEVKRYTPAQLEEYEAHIQKQAEAEELELLEKTAAAEDTMEAARMKRDMIKLSEEQLFNVHRAASGNNIAFPTFEDGRFEYRTGRVYRTFESWHKNAKNYKSASLSALVIDSKGGYNILKSNQPFMASTREPGHFELLTDQAKTMKSNHMYALEKDNHTLFNPFKVNASYIEEKLNDGIVVSVRERGGLASERTINSLFHDSFRCSEILPGRETNDNYPNPFFDRSFDIVISKDPMVKEPMFFNPEELREYIVRNAKDPEDSRLALNMVTFNESSILVPSDLPVFPLKTNIEHFYTRPDGLFKEGPMAKTAAFAGQNKATLVVKSNRQPKSYDVQWQFTSEADANGAQGTKVEKRSSKDLSRDQAQNMLSKLGYDYRAQSKFFEIADRNGREATFNLPDKEKAAQAAAPDVAKEKVKKKMSGLANSMLHSKNFMPIFEDTVAGGISSALSSMAPKSVSAVHKISDTWGKEAMETAVELEKVATRFNGAEWHEVSALVNLKHRLDKIAGEIAEGNYLYNGHQVFEKVAELKPAVIKKTRDLLEFNRQQLIKTSSYLVDPSLVKQAIHQLDGLYAYASVKKNEIIKEAGFFSRGQLLKSVDDKVGKLETELRSFHGNLENANAKLRAVMPEGEQSPRVQQALADVKAAEQQLTQGREALQQVHTERGLAEQQKAKGNLSLAAGVGIPGLAGASYGYEGMKNNE